MKKFLKHRYYGITIIGVVALFIGYYNCRSNFGMIIWGTGLIISIIGVLLQIVFAPNYENLKCPDCNADLEYKEDKLKFKKHSI